MYRNEFDYNVDQLHGVHGTLYMTHITRHEMKNDFAQLYLYVFTQMDCRHV